MTVAIAASNGTDYGVIGIGSSAVTPIQETSRKPWDCTNPLLKFHHTEGRRRQNYDADTGGATLPAGGGPALRPGGSAGNGVAGVDGEIAAAWAAPLIARCGLKGRPQAGWRWLRSPRRCSGGAQARATMPSPRIIPRIAALGCPSGSE